MAHPFNVLDALLGQPLEARATEAARFLAVNLTFTSNLPWAVQEIQT
jgi:hypothetical protein